MEIERKFLVKKLPDNLNMFPHVEIEQFYLCTTPTVRIRRMGEEYLLTIKEHYVMESAAIHNREEEFSLPLESYLVLKSKCSDLGISKSRYRIPLRTSENDGLYNNLIAELDLFYGRHEGLLLVEVEFPDTTVADSFIPPDWFGTEVSQDYRYRNSYLSNNPLPE